MSSQYRFRRNKSTHGAVSHPAKKLTQMEIDSNSHRLSKVPNKFNPKLAADTENPDTYASTFYKEHPNEKIDVRTPTEKLQDYEKQLSDRLDPETLFTLLNKQLTMRSIVYGESSHEVVQSHLSIGDFYILTKRPNGALRHYQRAKVIEETIGAIDEQMTAVSIGIAEANLLQREEGIQHISAAFTGLKSVEEKNIEDTFLRLRRDVALARVYAAKGNHKESLEFYEKVFCSEEDSESERADCYKEAGLEARALKRFESAAKFLGEAKQRYISMKNPSEAKKIDDIMARLPEESLAFEKDLDTKKAEKVTENESAKPKERESVSSSVSSSEETYDDFVTEEESKP